MWTINDLTFTAKQLLTQVVRLLQATESVCHPMLTLVDNSEQPLTRRYSRRLVTMQKTHAYNAEQAASALAAPHTGYVVSSQTREQSCQIRMQVPTCCCHLCSYIEAHACKYSESCTCQQAHWHVHASHLGLYWVKLYTCVLCFTFSSYANTWSNCCASQLAECHTCKTGVWILTVATANIYGPC